MKTLTALMLALLTLAPIRAQTLRPEAVNGAVLGGIAGAVIGHNSGDLRHNAWRGAAYGAGAGLLLGHLAGEANARYAGTQVPVPDYPRTYVYREAPGYYGQPVYRSYGGTYYNDADYDTGYAARPDYRGSGLVLGALAGAIIGHNSGDLRHNGWRGAAYGAGLGYVLGSIAEHNARRREAAAAMETVSVPAQTVPTGEPAAVQPAGSSVETIPVTAPAKPSSMSSANELFGRR
ncbi:YMGG-like glycine zipper-containing protein [Opitutus terrae]|uniref:17 kDa surface antigen n=1 Tax=Opitutus terrae (strain DSM 11246 / JCM 15787 / PB90-1) TaxID=452637 RepID=B1ZSS9_OPITP|nr:YMGG-like glycine zipper-containing protein [Opitutus terrae]ACB74773.1 hypothetical protein Oter_1489 [Opitutus terrae PB90-1]